MATVRSRYRDVNNLFRQDLRCITPMQEEQ